MKIRSKLLWGFGSMLLLALVLAGFGITSVGRLGGALDGAVNVTAKKLQLAGALSASFSEMKAEALKAELSIVNPLVGQVKAASGASQAPCATCHSGDSSGKQAFDATAARLKAQTADLRPLVTAAGEKQALESIEQGAAQWVVLYRKYLDLVSQHDFEAGHDIMLNKIYPLVDAMEKAAAQLTKQQQDGLAADSRDARNRVSGSRALGFGLLGLFMGVAVAAWYCVRGIAKLLRGLAAEMSEATEQVASAAGQVSASSDSLAKGASEQAASVEETSASTEQINSMTKRGAEHSRAAWEATSQTERQMQEANQALQEMTASMQAIGDSSQRISKIIQVIDEIAFQTNILALNAAVEAARAGEAGMGFAVVAEEVRNLAQRSAQAAEDTARLIEESISRSGEGSTKLAQVAAAIHVITEGGARVKTLMDELSVGSQEQARGIDQIAKALVQIEQVTQSAAANSEESAAAGAELNAQAAALRNVVGRLTAAV